MEINNSTRWLAQVSKQCRLLTETAVTSYVDMADEGFPGGQAKAAKRVLETHLDRLRELLPEDFPESRIGELSRHVQFSQAQDFSDIAAYDVPDVLEKAEEYAQSLTVDDRLGDLGDYIHPVYRQRVETELASPKPDFHQLILKCCILLGDEFKRKSGMKSDDDSDLGRAFRVDDPRLQIRPTLETQTDKNFQRGAQLLFQGARAFFRNTHAHENIMVSQRMGVRAVILLSVLSCILDRSTVKKTW